MKQKSRKPRKPRKSRKGGNSLAALGQAASNLLVPFGLYYGVKTQQKRMRR